MQPRMAVPVRGVKQKQLLRIKTILPLVILEDYLSRYGLLLADVILLFGYTVSE